MEKQILFYPPGDKEVYMYVKRILEERTKVLLEDVEKELEDRFRHVMSSTHLPEEILNNNVLNKYKNRTFTIEGDYLINKD